ncbi:MAG: HAMP domain-containing histidine kinase [Spirosoma sp.]|nr:HAMP domain-containing histidine kinase [Spirosoma sp.]
MHVLSSFSALMTMPVSLPALTTSETWLILLVLALPSQALFCYILWRMLRRQKGTIKTDVLHSVVHEFQTPVAAIRMAVDILDSPIARNQPERTEKYIRIIREETERLQHQVETMLTLARADQNTLILNPEPVSLCSLIETIAERHGNYLRVFLPVNPLLMADRLHLTNVLHNLIDNAVKYSPGTPQVFLNTATDANGVMLTIRDQGIGIPAHQLKQIFKPFFRVHDRSQPSVKGFGLGLSYVQRIVLAHNWRIDVTSEPGQGSEFRISIPLASILAPVNSPSIVQ